MLQVMATNILEPNYSKVWLLFGSLWDPEIFKIGGEWRPARLLRKSLRKDAEKGAHLTPLTCLNCMRGLKNHDPEALGKQVPKGLQKHPLKETFGFPRYVLGIVFRGLPRFPRRGRVAV